MRTKFICIIWTENAKGKLASSSWGLSLFVLFEHNATMSQERIGSWGLSLFVLFERILWQVLLELCSWGLSLFVLFELSDSVENYTYSSWGLSLFVLFEPYQIQAYGILVLED